MVQRRKKGIVRKHIDKSKRDYTKNLNQARESIRRLRYDSHNLGLRASYTMDGIKKYSYAAAGVGLIAASAAGVAVKNAGDDDIGQKVSNTVSEMRESNGWFNEVSEFAIDNAGYGMILGLLFLQRASAAAFRREFCTVRKYKPKYV